MNFTVEPIGEKNGSSPLPRDIEILGATVFYTYQSLIAIQGTLAVVGNLITLIAVYKYDFLWENNACRFIASLALADFLSGVQVFTAIARNTTKVLFIFHSLCKVDIFFIFLGHLGNIYSYLLLTIDRLIYIECPLRYISIVTQRRTLRAIIVIWIASIIQASSLVVWESEANEMHSCSFSTDTVFRRGGKEFGLILTFFLAFCVLAPIYGKIACTSWKLMKTDPHLSNFPPDDRTKQRKKLQERKMTLTIGVVFGVYLLCNIPLTVYFAVISNIYAQPYPFWVLLVYRLMTFVFRLQSVLNPLIYALKNRMLRAAYRKMFLISHVHPTNTGIDLYQC